MKRNLCIMTAGFFTLFSWGCSGTQENLSKNHGESTAVFKKYIINPEAEKNHDPVIGLRGVDAEAVYNKYVDSFAEKGTSGGEAGKSGNKDKVTLAIDPTTGKVYPTIDNGKIAIDPETGKTSPTIPYRNYSESPSDDTMVRVVPEEAPPNAPKSPIIPVDNGAVDPNPGGGFMPKVDGGYIHPNKGFIPDTGAPIIP